MKNKEAEKRLVIVMNAAALDLFKETCKKNGHVMSYLVRKWIEDYQYKNGGDLI